MAKPTTQVEETVKPNEIVVQNNRSMTPSYLQQDAEDYGGAGLSKRSQDFLLPFLYVAQSNSPQLNRKQEDKYIPGLEVGDIFNTATGKFWKGSEGILVLPAYYQPAEVEWVTRKAGGGYIDTYQTDDPIVKKVRIDPSDPRTRLTPPGPDGKTRQLVETRYHFVVDAESLQVVVIGFTSSGLQVSRQWMTLMDQFKTRVKDRLVTLPSWSRQYLIKTVYRTNDQGDWFQMIVEDKGYSPENQLDQREMARAFFKQAEEKGVVLGRPPEVDVTTATTSANTSGPTIDDEPPI